ncbi:tyrosine-type recombinase/integrase [Thioclava electrotropha]|uniref:Tyrosine-type recombinase/integrase n=1 Tax=Thioclava electrotropha TaxID=1549850 RepID=A0ABX6YWA9_9RHOB|nr:tyrosine-type recombinase/integrase [Thioclava electrotropha]QPZ92048.1 tyrosine-type recombinase/integrase [Thioclava electrotropha]
MLEELKNSPVSEAQVQAMLKEIVRRAVAGMIARQESGSVAEISESYLGRIDTETGHIRDAQRTRDWSVASTFAGEIARQNNLDQEALEAPAVARQVLSLLRRLNDLRARVERDFDDPLDVGRDLLIDHGLMPNRKAMKPPMLLSEAIEKACEEAPQDVETKIRVIGKLALAYFGDVPVASIVLEQSFEFLFKVWMLPKGWGKGHGRNRHEKIGKDLCPLQEIRDADARDAQLLEEILNLDTLSVPDKRRRLVQELIPRLTDGYLFVQRDMLNRIFRAALGRKRVGRDVNDDDRLVPSHAQLKNRLRAWHKSQKTPCKLPKRVSRPKRRMSWSLEHVSRLLRSPIYLGTSSPKQRGRKATARKCIIIRDAIYWVPLVMITMGVRPEEILQAAIPDVVRRDGILCLFVGDEEDAVLKNEQSRRVLPIPQTLLDLGFREWVVAKRKRGETWLFPEVQPDKSHGRRSQIFGDRLRNLLKTLKLQDAREDIYAMRRTLSSKLMGLGIDTGTRQRILGHLEGTTIDRHYSDHGLLELKDMLDAVDYGIEVGSDRRFGFPIIVGNRTAMQSALDVEVALTDRREVSAVQLRDAETDEIVFEAAISGRKAPSAYPWNECSALDEKEVASQIITLSRQYSLTMPASEEATAAVEHLLILVDDKPFYAPAARHSVTKESEEIENAPVADAEQVVQEADCRPVDLVAGDLVVCALPSRRAGLTKSTARPGIVVRTPTMAGRKFLDIAWGSPIETGGPAPHELAIAQAIEMAEAKLDIPTRFNLRRRFLVPEADTARLHRRLGRIGKSAEARLRETLVHAGDVSPEPVEEPVRKPRPLVVERKRSKSVRPHCPR